MSTQPSPGPRLPVASRCSTTDYYSLHEHREGVPGLVAHAVAPHEAAQAGDLGAAPQGQVRERLGAVRARGGEGAR